MVNLEKLKVNELKELLRERGLPISGRKVELIERLQEHVQENNDLDPQAPDVPQPSGQESETPSRPKRKVRSIYMADDGPNEADEGARQEPEALPGKKQRLDSVTQVIKQPESLGREVQADKSLAEPLQGQQVAHGFQEASYTGDQLAAGDVMEVDTQVPQGQPAVHTEAVASRVQEKLGQEPHAPAAGDDGRILGERQASSMDEARVNTSALSAPSADTSKAIAAQKPAVVNNEGTVGMSEQGAEGTATLAKPLEGQATGEQEAALAPEAEKHQQDSTLAPEAEKQQQDSTLAPEAEKQQQDSTLAPEAEKQDAERKQVAEKTVDSEAQVHSKASRAMDMDDMDTAPSGQGQHGPDLVGSSKVGGETGAGQSQEGAATVGMECGQPGEAKQGADAVVDGKGGDMQQKQDDDGKGVGEEGKNGTSSNVAGGVESMDIEKSVVEAAREEAKDVAEDQVGGGKEERREPKKAEVSKDKDSVQDNSGQQVQPPQAHSIVEEEEDMVDFGEEDEAIQEAQVQDIPENQQQKQQQPQQQQQDQQQGDGTELVKEVTEKREKVMEKSSSKEAGGKADQVEAPRQRKVDDEIQIVGEKAGKLSGKAAPDVEIVDQKEPGEVDKGSKGKSSRQSTDTPTDSVPLKDGERKSSKRQITFQPQPLGKQPSTKVVSSSIDLASKLTARSAEKDSKAKESEKSKPEQPPEKREVPPSTRPKSKALYISGFVRPFTEKKLVAFLEENGKIEDYYLPAIKTHCFVVFETEEQAEATRQATYNVNWPSWNKKMLKPEFVAEDEAKAKIYQGKNNIGTVQVPADQAPVLQKDHTGRLVTSDPLDQRRLQQQDSLVFDSIPQNPAGLIDLVEIREEQVQDKDEVIRELDQVFVKTISEPHIYFMPLSDHLVDLKKRMQKEGKSLPDPGKRDPGPKPRRVLEIEARNAAAEKQREEELIQQDFKRQNHMAIEVENAVRRHQRVEAPLIAERGAQYHDYDRPMQDMNGVGRPGFEDAPNEHMFQERIARGRRPSEFGYAPRRGFGRYGRRGHRARGHW